MSYLNPLLSPPGYPYAPMNIAVCKSQTPLRHGQFPVVH